MCQNIGEVFAGVPAAGEEECDAVTVARRHDARGEDPGALVGLWVGRVRLGRLGLCAQVEDLGGRVVVVQHVSLRGFLDELVVGGRQPLGRTLDQLPLCRGRQRDAQALLQLLDAIEWETGTILEKPDHARHRLVVLLPADSRRRLGGEHLAAQIATQPRALVHRGPERRHAPDAHHNCRLGERIDLAVVTLGAILPAVQRRVWDSDLLGAAVGCGSVAAVARGFGLRGGIRARSTRGLARGSFAEHLTGLLRTRAEQKLAQPFDARSLRRQFLGEEGERFHLRLERRVVRLGQRCGFGALDNALQFVESELAPLQRHFSPLRLSLRPFRHASLASRARKSCTKG